MSNYENTKTQKKIKTRVNTKLAILINKDARLKDLYSNMDKIKSSGLQSPQQFEIKNLYSQKKEA